MRRCAMARALWLIADDYGLGERHDAVIRTLLAASAIDGTSVMVETCGQDSASALAQLWTPDRRVGLHFNLTWSPAGAPARPGRSTLLARSALGFGRAHAAAMLEAQWRQFLSLFGRAPDYIDGHEHCHAFPNVRDAVLAFARQKDVAVRSMVPLGAPHGLKDRVIASLGSGVRRKARRDGIRTNWRFGGILPFADPEHAITLLRTEIDEARRIAGGLPDGKEIWIMTHPGDAGDPVQIPGHPPELRALEAAFLGEWSLSDAPAAVSQD